MSWQSFTQKVMRRVSVAFPLATLLLLLVCIVVTIGLGNPLGRPTGVQHFNHQVESGQVQFESTSPDRRMEELAAWADGYLTSLAGHFSLPRATATVRLLDSRRDYVEFGERFIPGFHREMDFCYSPASRAVYGYMTSTRKMRPRLQHELLHALADSVQQAEWPLWLEEGLAEYCESLEANEQGVLELSAVQYDRMRSVGRSALHGELFNPDRLRHLGRSAFMGKDADLHYSISYSVVLMLARQDRLHESLRRGVVLIDHQELHDFVTNPHAWSGDAAQDASENDRSEAWEIVTRTDPRKRDWSLAQRR